MIAIEAIMTIGPFETDHIYNMDCLQAMKQMPDKSVDLVLTDPPYGISYRTGYRKQNWHRFCSEIENDTNTEWSYPCCIELERVMKNDTALYWFSNHDAIDVIKPVISKRFTYKNTITWVKNNWTAGDLKAQYGKQTELLIYANKGRRFINGTRDQDVWYCGRVSGDSQLHQNEKPIELIERAILKSSSPGDLILDPFMGSGTTAVAAIKTGRHFIGFEIDKTYYDMACKRIGYEQQQMFIPFEKSD